MAHASRSAHSRQLCPQVGRCWGAAVSWRPRTGAAKTCPCGVPFQSHIEWQQQWEVLLPAAVFLSAIVLGSSCPSTDTQLPCISPSFQAFHQLFTNSRFRCANEGGRQCYATSEERSSGVQTCSRIHWHFQPHRLPVPQLHAEVGIGNSFIVPRCKFARGQRTCRVGRPNGQAAGGGRGLRAIHDHNATKHLLHPSAWSRGR